MLKPARPLLRRPLSRFEVLEGRRLLATDLGQITGTVLNDLENDGTADVAAISQQVELFLDNTGAGTVGTFDANDVSQTTTTTDGTGAYSFDNLEAGTYFVRVNPIAGTRTRTDGEAVTSAITISPAQAMGSTNLTIDDFVTAQDATATRNLGNALPAPVDSADGTNATDGGVRDLRAVYTDGDSGELKIASSEFGSQRLSVSSTSGVSGTVRAVWDGADADADTVTTNLLNLNLLGAGNENSGIVIEATSDREIDFRLRVHDRSGNISEATITIVDLDGFGNTQLDEEIFVSFVDTDGDALTDGEFNAVGGTAADFSDVGAIELIVDASGLNALDAEFEVIGVVGLTEVVADPLTVLNEMSLGDQVWIDLDNDGMFETGESGVQGVALTLFEDENNNDLIDAGEATPVDTTTTDASGNYLFTGLLPGDYLVRVDASNFTAGNPLAGVATSTGNDVAGMAPDTDLINEDDKDKGTAQNDGSVLSKAVTLVGNFEPINDGDTDANTNRTLDFGFFGYDLSITKGVNAAAAAIGDTLRYTIVVTNEGPTTATGVDLVDTLPDGVTFVSGTTTVGGQSVNGSAASQTINTTIGTLLSGQTATITIDATIDNDATGDLTNSATTSGTDETDVLSNTATAVTTVSPRIDVQITKVDDDNDQTLAPGDTVTYTLTARNNGPSTATSVVVTDTLPDGMTFVSAGSTTPANNTAVGATTQLTYNLGTMVAGDAGEQTITIVAQIDTDTTDGVLTNNASITAAETEIVPPGTTNNTASASSTVAIPLGSLNGKVYVDIDGDNVQDAEDQPIAGVLLTLFNDQGQAVGTTTTDANGCYEFTGLVPGVYRVVQTQPAAFPDLDETSGTPGADPAGDNQISSITVVGNQVSPANDFTEGVPTLGKRSFFWSRLFGPDNVLNV